MKAKPKIFVFVNQGDGTDWQVGVAMAEDGTYLNGHCSSSRYFFRMDMGLDEKSDWTGKRKSYDAHYPDGYELEEIPEGGAVRTHEGLQAAIALYETDANRRESIKHVEVTFSE